MTGSSTEQASHVFGCLHGMVRTAALYPPMHGQTVKAKQTLHEALTTYLSAHGRLVYGFVGDVLVADNRILPRESLLYRRFLALCQNERHIGSISFIAGVEPREIDALLEAVTNGAGDEPSAWGSCSACRRPCSGRSPWPACSTTSARSLCPSRSSKSPARSTRRNGGSCDVIPSSVRIC